MTYFEDLFYSSTEIEQTVTKYKNTANYKAALNEASAVLISTVNHYNQKAYVIARSYDYNITQTNISTAVGALGDSLKQIPSIYTQIAGQVLSLGSLIYSAINQADIIRDKEQLEYLNAQIKSYVPLSVFLQKELEKQNNPIKTLAQNPLAWGAVGLSLFAISKI